MATNYWIAGGQNHGVLAMVEPNDVNHETISHDGEQLSFYAAFHSTMADLNSVRIHSPVNLSREDRKGAFLRLMEERRYLELARPTS